MSKFGRRLVLAPVSTMALLVGLGTPAAALAQTAGGASATPAPTATEDPSGDDIVITAERRSQRLQDVPISATVLGSEDLLTKGVTNTADLQRVAPSVAINTYNRSTYINIRGVGTAQSASNGSPGVAYYIDGQLIPHDQFLALSFYDLGSIEVLRGPQGTLTGQNSTGGAIYVRTPEPKFGQFSGMLDQTLGNYGLVRTVGAVNMPLGENFAVRASGTYNNRNSFYTNIGSSPSTPGDDNLKAGRINIAGRSSDDRFHFNLRGDVFDSLTGYVAIKRRNDTVSADPFTIQEDANSFQRQHGYRLTGEVRFPISDGVDLRVLSGFQNLYSRDQADGDHTNTAAPRPPAANIGRVALTETNYDIFETEINLISTGNGPLNWVVGAFYYNEQADVSSQRDNNNTVNFVSSTAGFVFRANSISKSLFGQTEWKFADKFALIVGARYSFDTQIFDRLQFNGAVPPGNQIRSIPKSEKLTGKAALNFKPSDSTLIYASASRGYKAGGGNVTLGADSFGPETNTVYEIGAKTRVFDRHLRFSTAAFYSDYKGLQLSGVINGLSLTQNAAAGRSYGAEFEATATFGGLSIDGGVSYLKAEFRGDGLCLVNTNASTPTVPTPPTPAVPCPTGTQTIPNGRTLPFSPEWTINAGIQYEIPIGSGIKLTPRAQWSHVGSQVATPFPSSTTIVPKHDTFDLRLTLDINDRYQLQGYVTNVTDARYIATQVQDSSSVAGGIIWGAPRQFGARLVVKFGD